VSAELPVRLEFFATTLRETARSSNLASQRSLDPIETVRLTPPGMALLVADALRASMPDGLEGLLSPEALEPVARKAAAPEGCGG